MTGIPHKCRLLPWLFAALFAVRAIVPIGYMVSMPADDAGAIALDLCPLQNANLDFDLLARVDGAAAPHHLHSGLHAGADTTNAPPEPTVSLSSTDCADWLSSAIAVTAGSRLRPALPAVPANQPSDSDQLRATRVLPGGAQPRAPPLPIA